MNSKRSRRGGSSYRERLMMDPNEKEENEKYAREEHEYQLEELRNSPGITHNDVRDYEKSVIIKRSVEEVQRRAIEQKVIRGSPKRY